MFESPLIQLEIQMLIKAKWLNKEINAIMGKKLQYIIMQVQIWSSIEKYWEKKKKEGNKHKKQNESALSKICLIKSHWTCWKSFIKFDTNFLCAFLDFTISCLLYSLVMSAAEFLLLSVKFYHGGNRKRGPVLNVALQGWYNTMMPSWWSS